MTKNIIFFFIIIYLILFLFALLLSNRIIFQPPRSGYQNSNNIIKIQTAGGNIISAIYLNNPKAKYTFLINHGNAEDIGYMEWFLQDIKKHGYSVFAYDYSGYGTSSGRPSEKTAYQDAGAAYNYMTNKLGISPGRIIAFGNSVGAAMAIHLAVGKKVAAVIAQSPFVSAFRVMTRMPVLPFDKFNNLNKISRIHCPLLLIHGTKDRIVPIWHSKKLYNKAKQPKYYYWVENAGHNNLYSIAGNNYWKEIDKFIKTLDITTHTTPSHGLAAE